MTDLQSQLFAFEPVTEGQKILPSETLAASDRVLPARRQRLDAVGTGLPIVVWWALLPGAMGCLILSLFVPVEDTRHEVRRPAHRRGLLVAALRRTSQVPAPVTTARRAMRGESS